MKLGVCLAAAAVCAAACSSGLGHVQDFGHVPSGGSDGTIQLVAGESCPATLSNATDVRSQPGLPSDRLLPLAAPSAARICAYVPSGVGIGNVLAQDLRLNAAKAQQLANAIDQLSLKRATGRFSCPMDQIGYHTVIAFTYPNGKQADLWYHTSGCRSLDNGNLLAFQGANPSFYDGFEPLFDKLAPAPKPITPRPADALVAGKVAIYIHDAPTSVVADGRTFEITVVMVNGLGHSFVIPDACNGWLEPGLASDAVHSLMANGGVACAGLTVPTGITRVTRRVPTSYFGCSQDPYAPATVNEPHCLGPQHNQMPALPPGAYRLQFDIGGVPDPVIPDPVTIVLTKA